MKTKKSAGRVLARSGFNTRIDAKHRGATILAEAARAWVEPLETRVLLSALQWIPEGPNPQYNAGDTIGPTNATQQDVGAVEALAVNPSNTKDILAGTVNGGIWQTTDFTAASPVWTTTTDQMPSLSIHSLAFSPVNSNVIYAGTGGNSSFGVNGPSVGIYKSTDGGSTWQVINPNGIFTGDGILRIIPTTLNGGQTIFLATDPYITAQGGGVYRSDNGGTSWTRLSGTNGLPGNNVTDLVENPDNANQFFAAIPNASGGANNGIYELNLGVSNSWVNITHNILSADLSVSARIELSVSPAGANPVWATVVNNGGWYQRIYRGVASGSTFNWAQVGPSQSPPDIYGDPQGTLHGAVLASPTSDTQVYISGSATPAGEAAGDIVRGDSVANTWTAITLSAGSSGDAGTVVPTDNGDTTAPHADSRALVMASGGVLLCACDGGVYQGTNPSSTSSGAQVWTSINGNGNGIENTEFYSISYDSQSHTIFGGAQDVGTPTETGQGSLTYYDESGGDGSAATTDNFTRAGIGQSIRYTFGGTREYFNGAISQPGGETYAFILPPGGLSGFGDAADDLFTTSIVDSIGPTAGQLSAGQSTQMVVSGQVTKTITNPDKSTTVVNAPGGTGAVYESSNAGTASEFTAVGPDGKNHIYAHVTWNLVPTGPGFVQTSAMAYGGRSGGVDNSAILYAASGSQIFLRTVAGGTLTATAALPAGASAITGIALDPNNWHTAFVSDSTHVYMTSDAGAHWTNITGNLTDPGSALTVVPTLNELIIAGSHGVQGMPLNNPGVWSIFGQGLPTNVIVVGSSMVYNEADNVIVLGTLGRGAWKIQLPPVIYVDSTATGPVHDGSSWQDAFTSLAQALAPGIAPFGSVIEVAAGSYSPGPNKTDTFQLENGVTIQGGYAAGGSDIAEPNVNTTILSGSGNNYHVVTGSGTDTTAVLNGFEIAGGTANGSSFFQKIGGGMLNDAGSPRVINCVFVLNSATLDGGGMANYGALAPYVVNCKFLFNSSGGGGGLYDYNSSSNIVNCLFNDNTASDQGGGIFEENSTSTIVNCTFSVNSSPFGGGVAYVLGSGSFFNNILWNDSSAHGELYVSSATPNVSVSDIQGGYSGGSNILTSDPLIIPGSNLYELQPNSPAINDGDYAGAAFLDDIVGVNTDLAGAPRTHSNQIDLGATETQVYYVDAGATGTGDGSSWGNAFTSLTTALNSAQTLEIIANTIGGGQPIPVHIYIAHGVYYASTTTKTGTFQLIDDVTIEGGFAGHTNPSAARNVALYPTTLAGALFDYHVVTASGTDSTAVLDGFTIGGGSASGTGDSNSGYGGGMLDVNGDPTINNCIFAGSTALLNGGAVYISQGAPAFTDCVFNQNSVTTNSLSGYNGIGGAVFANSSSTANFINCSFGDNSATSAGGALGDGLASISTLKNSILWNDPTGGGGQEIYNDGPSGAAAHLSNSDIQFGSPLYTGNNNIFTDPMFTSGSNLQLLVDSPAINRGLNSAISGFSTDAIGKQRVVDTTVDMGAYEYQGPFTLYVNHAATGGANNGTSWTNAFLTIQQALAMATPGYTVDVAAGDYSPGSSFNSTFQLVSGVTLQGGFVSGATSPAPNVNLTFLDGQHNATHVVTASGTNASTILNGFVIENGNANASGAGNFFGGGIYNSGGSPQIINCTFIGNAAADGGGAIENTNHANASITNCLFENNSTPGSGGAIDNQSSTTFLFNCAFVGNTANSNGGAVNDSASPVGITNCSFSGNSSPNGKAISNISASPSVYNCILWDGGNEIYVNVGSPNVEYSDVQGGFSGTANLNQNPNFTTGTNLQLMTGSPCIGTGFNSAEITQTTRTGINTDLAGNPRVYPAGGMVDMGAYENQGPISLLYAPGPPSTVTAGTTLPTVIVDVEQNGALTTLQDGTSVVLVVNAVQVASAVVSGGQARFSGLVFNTPGHYSLIASDGSDGTLTQPFSVISGAPTLSLQFGGLPVGINTNQVLPEFGVEVLSGGQIDTGDSSIISLYLDNTNTLLGTAQVGANDPGYALFNNVAFPTSGAHFIQARDTTDGITLNSGNIQISDPAPIYTLFFGPLPTNPVVNNALNPEITVYERVSSDPNSALVPDSTSSITLSVSGGTLSGDALTKQLSGGSISFNETPTTNSTTYTITASDGNDHTATLVFPVFPEHLVFNYPSQTMPSFTQGQNQFLPSFTVSVVAQNGSVVSTDNSNITVTVLIPNTAGYIPRTSSTGGTGTATFSTSFSNGFFLGNLIESYDVVLQATDSTDNATGDSAGFVVNPAPPHNLSVFGGGITPAGTSVSPGFGFTESDQFNDSIYNDSTSVTASISGGPAGGDFVAGSTLTEPLDVGFNNLIFNKAGNYTVLFTDATTGLSTSADVTITGGSPTHLVFLQEPTTSSAGTPIEPPVQVAEEDSFNDISTLYTGSITLSVASPSGVPLNGTVTVPVTNGVANFANISIAQVGNNYTLSALDSNNASLTATSTSFNIVAPMTIYVDQNAAGGGDGTSWATAFQTLQSALGVAISGDVVDVATGDYSPGGSATNTYTLLDGVTIQGGFPTGGSVLPNPSANPTTLDGMNNNYHVVSADGVNSTAILEGFTITGGNANGMGDADSGFGGGLLADGGSPTVTDCTFSANAAVTGGAMYITNQGFSPATITGCIFLNNTATMAAGAIYISSASPMILNSQFLSNSTTASGNGGAIYNQGSNGTFVNCLFVGNVANQLSGPDEGGAIFNAASSPTIINCTISGNSAIYGGGIANDGTSSPILTNDILWNDTATYGGNEIYLGTPTVTNSVVDGGYAGAGNINSDPLFVNAAGGNYQLQPTSPAINAGSNGALVAGTTTDLAGNSRIVDGVVDMGAYEAVVVGVTWTGADDGVNWSDAGNWSDLLVPTQSDDVTVGPGFTTIQVGAGAFSVHTLSAQSAIEIDSGATLSLNGQSSFNGLTIDNGGTVMVVADPVVVAVTGLTISTGGTLDLNDNGLIVHDGDLSAISAMLFHGFNAQAGYWNGTTGIVSGKAANDSKFLTTLGVRQSDGSTFEGVSTTTSDVLVKYTYYGDATLDGSVDGADYQQIDSGFGSHASDWAHGDFNYDGVINGLDYALIDNAFNQVAATGASPLALIASPQAIQGAANPIIGNSTSDAAPTDGDKLRQNIDELLDASRNAE